MFKFLLIIKGAALGVANIIPGLSGGTVAVILGVYQSLIDALASLLTFKREQFVDSFIFLSFIGMGVLGGVFCFSFIIDWVLSSYLESVSYFFIAIILSSIPYIIKSESINLFTISRFIFCVLGVLIGLLLISIKFYFFADNLVVHHSYLYLFVSVMVAAATMIIPGISGSLVLVLFGTYSIVIAAIKEMVFFDLVIIALAVVIGIFGCSKILQLCIRHYFQLTMSVVIGLMLGTLPGLYNGFTVSLLFFNITFFIVGVLVIWSVKFFR